MKKGLFISISISILLFTGCGGGGSNETSNRDQIGSASPHKSKTYNLWEYMTPQSSDTKTYTLLSQNRSINYKTTFDVKRDRVVEINDYAANEKTIYEKKSDSIVVKFEKNGKPNGTYTLHLSADIGDIITKRSSNCELKAHYDTKEIEGKVFNDVIEIRCGETPGFYQKGVGEIAQIEGGASKKVRVLSN
jgi:outer membrane biogenesis lipoprotein LolB